jgi:hypothetical protein
MLCQVLGASQEMSSGPAGAADVAVAPDGSLRVAPAEATTTGEGAGAGSLLLSGSGVIFEHAA